MNDCFIYFVGRMKKCHFINSWTKALSYFSDTTSWIDLISPPTYSLVKMNQKGSFKVSKFDPVDRHITIYMYKTTGRCQCVSFKYAIWRKISEGKETHGVYS